MGPGNLLLSLSLVTHFFCPDDEGYREGESSEKPKEERGENFFSCYPHESHCSPSSPVWAGSWFSHSISPKRAVNHTLSNAERWLQAPSAFIINHWDREDMSPHLQNHWSGGHGLILPENDFSAFLHRTWSFGSQTQRNCSLGQHPNILEKFS